jgi:hypothetical protein
MTFTATAPIALSGFAVICGSFADISYARYCTVMRSIATAARKSR